MLTASAPRGTTPLRAPVALPESAAYCLPDFARRQEIVHYTAGINARAPSPQSMRGIAENTSTFSKSLMAGSPAPSSFFVLDLDHVSSKLDAWRRLLPAVEPFYAVKANPDTAMLRHLASNGTSFDCASPHEIKLVLDQGVHPHRIIYAHPCKPPAALAYAAEVGVTRTVFDSVGELDKLVAYAPGMSVLLRIWVDDSGAQCPLSNKFGAGRSEWSTLFAAATARGVHIDGVSLHVGSGTNDPGVFTAALNDALSAFGMGAAAGHTMAIMDIGGGFPGTCTDRSSIDTIAATVRPVLDKFPQGTRFIAEPGRYLAAEAQTLATMVIGAREAPPRKPTYFVADGLYGSFNCILYDHSELNSTPLFPPEDRQRMRSSVLFGQTCDGIDQISADMDLPAELNVGDWLVFPGMGAYTNAASSRFNGFENPPVLPVGG